MPLPAGRGAQVIHPRDCCVMSSSPASKLSDGASENRARRILDNLYTAVLSCDQGARVIMANPAAELLFGLSANHMLHRPLLELFGSDRLAFAPVAKALGSGQPVTAHGIRLTVAPDTPIIVDYTVTPLVRWNGVERLILELRRVDRFLRLAREETLVDSHTANRAVIRGLAHEIKNPLGGLRGAAQLLDRELPDRRQRDYTRIIIYEADRLRNLVDRMMGSRRPLRPKPVNIHQVLEHVRKLMLVEAREGLTIERDYDPSLPDLKGDREQLIQAVLNVVRNAVEAMDGRGRIRFRSRVERFLTIAQIPHRHVIRVDIEDNGPGIPVELQEQIFYPMVTQRAEGAGLGLAITQDIVAKHGGLIEFNSVPGCTCFSLYLPITEPV